MDKEIERCNLCVLPKSHFLGFDDGTCSLCNAARRTSTVSRDTGGLRERLEEYIQRIKEQGRGQSFDCVVGTSGGRDSSYLLYLLTHKHHLRCLAGYYRTPFTSSVTDANVRRLTSKLNVPLVEIGISKELHRRIAREFTILWTEKPHPVIANMACAPCKLVNREIFEIARANGIIEFCINNRKV
jgi:tRNA(Ile)-lysidine synthase TilS/MesJ